MVVRAILGCLLLVLFDGPRAAFTLGGVEYFHRYANGDQHEYTPAGQEDLNAWTDMVTLIAYRNVKDGEGLAATANSVLETYKKNNAQILKTDSVPRTADKPAEHLIVAVFPQPEFIEVAFARFRMSGGVGTAAVRSHRVYGKQAGPATQDWLAKNGRATEESLMAWDAMPAMP